MKKCPYCAEEIQDDAIKCRYCLSDLTKPVPSGAETTAAPETTVGADPAASTLTMAPSVSSEATAPAAISPGSIQYTHSGYRYVLGYGADFFGLWDRQAPAAAVERFPRTDEGWRQAWVRFASLEPNHVTVPQVAAATSQAGAFVAPPASPIDTSDVDVLQYTHSGQRYLLGYGKTFFGIWDRQSPATPAERFTRDDSGWQAAWRRFTTLETHYTEVGLGGAGAASEAPTVT